MGLYLCVFHGDDELDGVDVGSYADFNFFRRTVSDRLEGGIPGSKFPTLILHSDCDGEWTVGQCCELEDELLVINAAFKELPAVDFDSGWQKEVAKSLGLKTDCLCQSFIDVDGEPLLERLLALCQLAKNRNESILFQ